MKKKNLLAIVGALVLCISLFGCKKTEPAETVTSEVPSQMEIIETSEEPSEEVEMKEAPKKIELNLADGEEYQPEHYSSEDVYNQISELEKIAKEKFDGAPDYFYKRDCLIAMFCMGNYDLIDEAVLKDISSDYLAQWSESDLTTGCYINYYNTDDVDYIDSCDVNLYLDPVYRNEMEIFNYYLELYLNENDSNKKSEYADIINSAVYGNEYGIFPLTFDEDHKTYNKSFYMGLLNKFYEFSDKKFSNHDFDNQDALYKSDGFNDMRNDSNIFFGENARRIECSEGTMIIDGSQYIPSHK